MTRGQDDKMTSETNSAAPRYYSITGSGASTLTFNATSIQNAVLLGFIVLVLGALILPLFGVNLLASDEVSTVRQE